MTFFISTRTKFLRRFEKKDNGFSYRETARSRAIFVSAQERDWLIAEFDRLHAQVRPILFAAFLLAIAVSSQVPRTKSYGGTVFLLTVIGVAAAFSLYFDRRARLFKRGRSFIDEGLPRTEADRLERSNMSWAYLLTLLFFACTGINDAFWTQNHVIQLVLFFGGGIAICYIVWQVMQKIKDSLRDERLRKR